MSFLEVAFDSIRQGIPCLFHFFTGLYCPGCGGTRAVKFLIQGDIARSVQFHPLVVYTAAVVLVELGSYALSRALRRPGLFVGHVDWFTYGGVAITAVNWIYKNYMLVARGVDLLV